MENRLIEEEQVRERKTGFEKKWKGKEDREERSGREEKLRMQLFPKEESAYRKKIVDKKENQIGRI